MAFAQLTYRESLRDIEACLRANQSKLYHLGVREKVSRNTLAHANQNRDWRIYTDFVQILIRKARKLYAENSFGIELDQATSLHYFTGPERDLGTAVIVDDDENQRIMASELLQRINSHVWAVASGEEAVAYIQDRQADLVMLDMLMEPGIDGLKTYSLPFSASRILSMN